MLYRSNVSARRSTNTRRTRARTITVRRPLGIYYARKLFAAVINPNNTVVISLPTDRRDTRPGTRLYASAASPDTLSCHAGNLDLCSDARACEYTGPNRTNTAAAYFGVFVAPPPGRTDSGDVRTIREYALGNGIFSVRYEIEFCFEQIARG